MKFNNFTLLKLTISFILGILASHYFMISLEVSMLLFGASFTLFSSCFFYFKNKRKEKSVAFGVTSLLTMTCLGILSYTLALPENQANYFGHHLNANTTNATVFKIERRLKSNAYYNKYYANVISINNTATIGRVLIQQKKDSSLLYVPDAVLVSTNKISNIKPPKNPYQFDYSHYLRQQGVYYQIYTTNESVKNLKNKYSSYKSWSHHLISKINTALKKHKFDTDGQAILNALLLGQKQDISNELYNSYTNSGAIHILAVSGLHIGIILLILQFLLNPIFNFKYGNYLKALTLIALLWSYALFTGGSASVTRATTMFSLVAIAINLKRKTNIYNTLIVSILILLIIKPLFIFDVGFQLSYAAVFSIVAFQPLIAKLIHTRFTAINYLWKVLSVTLAAQFGIIPFSLLYFHQFPSLFWLSNLIIIPLLPFILGLGILVVLLIVFNTPFNLSHFFIMCLNYILKGMNGLLRWISSFETFVIKDIYFNWALVFVSLLFVFSIHKLWMKYNYKRLLFFLACIISLQTTYLVSYKNTTHNELVILHKTKSTHICIKKGHELTINNTEAKENYITRSYKVGSNINKTTYDSIKPFYSFGNTKLLVVDSLGIYTLKSFKPDIVLLRNSPKINLDRLIETIKPKKIIADGSNYKSYINRWSETCKNKKGLFHSTEKGAFVLKF